MREELMDLFYSLIAALALQLHNSDIDAIKNPKTANRSQELLFLLVFFYHLHCFVNGYC